MTEGLREKKNKELVKGCEHDGSYVPISEVYRLMNLARDEEKSKALLALESNFVLETMSQDKVKFWIKECEGKHKQQVAYSSYHDAMTQVCFGCKKIRTNGDFK